MATTIDRSGITPTNDTGTPASPVGDGTLINAAFMALVYDEIDQLFNGTTADPFVFGPKLKVDGFGQHLFSSGGTGANDLVVRNTTSGTGNYAGLRVGNNSTANLGSLLGFSSAFTSAGYNFASGVTLEATGAGGLSVAASNASGGVTFYTGGTNERLVVTAQGRLTIKAGAVASGAAITSFSGNHVVMAAGGSGAQAGIVAWGDGSGYELDFGYRDSGGGTFQNSIKFTDHGRIRVNDGSVAAPAYSFLSDTDTGIYWGGANDLRIGAAGVVAMVITNAGVPSVRVESGSFGTGAVGGASFSVGRNNSGSGAAGTIGFNTRTLANFRYVWVDDSGNLRIAASRPTEDNTTVSDTSGTVVGTQTSLRSTKHAITRYEDNAAALALLLRTPLYRFRYRDGDPDTDHVGVMADDSPEFARFGGTTFDPVNAFGYSAAAIKALAARVASLEAQA